MKSFRPYAGNIDDKPSKFPTYEQFQKQYPAKKQEELKQKRREALLTMTDKQAAEKAKLKYMEAIASVEKEYENLKDKVRSQRQEIQRRDLRTRLRAEKQLSIEMTQKALDLVNLKRSIEYTNSMAQNTLPKEERLYQRNERLSMQEMNRKHRQRLIDAGKYSSLLGDIEVDNPTSAMSNTKEDRGLTKNQNSSMHVIEEDPQRGLLQPTSHPSGRLKQNSDLEVVSNTSQTAPGKQSEQKNWLGYSNKVDDAGHTYRGFNAKQLVEEIRKQQKQGPEIQIKGLGYESCTLRKVQLQEQAKERQKNKANNMNCVGWNRFEEENKVHKKFVNSQSIYYKREKALFEELEQKLEEEHMTLKMKMFCEYEDKLEEEQSIRELQGDQSEKADQTIEDSQIIGNELEADIHEKERGHPSQLEVRKEHSFRLMSNKKTTAMDSKESHMQSPTSAFTIDQFNEDIEQAKDFGTIKDLVKDLTSNQKKLNDFATKQDIASRRAYLPHLNIHTPREKGSDALVSGISHTFEPNSTKHSGQHPKFITGFPGNVDYFATGRYKSNRFFDREPSKMRVTIGQALFNLNKTVQAPTSTASKRSTARSFMKHQTKNILANIKSAEGRQRNKLPLSLGRTGFKEMSFKPFETSRQPQTLADAAFEETTQQALQLIRL